ncbi:MAG: hypothetical protein WC926_02120 [Candidatus Paceibacterota bacterium]|jgi:hypothetical protein
MSNSKRYIIVILSVAAIAAIGLFFYTPGSKEIVPPAPEDLNGSGAATSTGQNDLGKTDPAVTISVDKKEYDEGETINIGINNGLGDPVLYYGDGDRIWGIEYFKDGEWTDHEWFQTAREENIGDDCYVVFYERMEPVELAAGSGITRQWDQELCPDSEEAPDKPRTVKNIESGQYRLTFVYGFGKDKEDPYKLLDYRTVYSDSFVIKQ